MNWYDRFLCVFFGTASVAILVTACSLTPDPRGVGTHEQLGLPPCAFLQDHRMPCISCGMTTAFAAAAHGDLPAAFRANPFGIVLFVLAAIAPFHCIRCWRRADSPLAILSHRRAAFWLPVFLVTLLVNWGAMILVHRHGHPN